MRFPQINKYFEYNYDRNIVQVFKPLYVLLSFVGLFPYAIDFPKGRHDIRITQKPLGFHIVGAILSIAFLCYCFTEKILIAIDTSTNSYVTNLTNFIEIFVTILSAIVIYFCAFQNAKIYLQILRDISSCWANLSQVNVDAILMYLQKLFVLPAIAWLVIFSGVQTALCIIGTQTVYNQLLLYALSDALPGLVVAFYSALVLLVVGLMKNIEQHCKMIVSKRHNSAKVKSEEPNVRTVESADVIELSALQQSYVKVLVIKQDINNAFQAPIPLIVIHCFLGILADSHAMYREVVVTHQFDAYILLDQTFWVLYNFVKIYALTFTGTLLKTEAIKIGQTLHDIPTKNLDNRLLMEVQHFATLMSFRRPIITVYDYFSLDATLLFSMIATVVTYLIILVQFDSV